MVLERIASWLRLLWDAGLTAEKNAKDIETLQEHNERLSESIKLLLLQQEHDRQMNEQKIEALRRELLAAQENAELRLRLDVSEKMRQLPPDSRDK